MNENILITGAANGIGKELAYKFAKNKDNLLLVDIDNHNLEKVKNELLSAFDISVMTINQDLSKLDSTDILLKKIEKMGFIPDILINNAGIGVYGHFLNTKSGAEEKMMNLNMLSLFKLTKFYSRKMITAGGGKIINISSLAGFHGTPNLSVYSATKAFVINLSEALAYEFRNENLDIKVFCPGPTKSNFAKTANYSGGKTTHAVPAEKMAEYIFNSISSQMVVNVPGMKSKILVFVNRLLPRDLITNLIGKLVEN